MHDLDCARPGSSHPEVTQALKPKDPRPLTVFTRRTRRSRPPGGQCDLPCRSRSGSQEM